MTTRPAYWLKGYGAALLTIAALDALWLGVIARDFYRSEMALVIADQVRLAPALAFYLGYPAGLVALVLAPRPAHFQAAAARGGLVGVLAYGTYDLTNMATLADWSMRLGLLDIAWGTLLSTAAAVAAWYATRRDVMR